MRYDGSDLDLRQHLSIAYLLSLPAERRRRIRLYTGHWPYVAGELLGDDLFAFTMLRDPVERTISLLRQHRASLRANDVPGAADLTLEAVYEDPMFFEPFVHNHQTRIFSMTREDEPRGYLHVIDVDDRRLELAKRNLARIDVVGLTEEYPSFVAELSRRSGLAIEVGRNSNVTRADQKDPVGESFRRRIAADNRFDVELYEHARELVARRR
jgi:hypothetical protein